MQSAEAAKFIHDMLRALGQLKATELLLASGRAPAMMMKGQDKHTAVSKKAVSSEAAWELARSIMSDEQAIRFESTGACEFAYNPAGIGNFQAIATDQEGNISLTLRPVTAVPTKDSRGMLAG